MLDTLNQLDHSLLLFLNYDGGGLCDMLWYAISQIWVWLPFYGVLLYVLFLSAKPHERPVMQYLSLLVATALLIVLADRLSSGVIKPMVMRLRPSHEPEYNLLLHYVADYRGGTYGFVSSHAANTVALATWIALLFRQRAVVFTMTLFALLNCYSRLYLGVHFPGDVLCGSVLGAVVAYVVYRAFSAFAGRFTPTPQAARLVPATMCLLLSLILCYSLVVVFLPSLSPLANGC